MGNLSGNKGEWSEVYVFLKLLAEGKLYGADQNLNALPDIFFPIISILRRENGRNLKFLLNGNIRVIEGNTNELLLSLPVAEFLTKSQVLLDRLQNSRGNSLQFDEIEQFLNSIHVHTIEDSKTDKSDIRLIIHDLRTGLTPELGFSIKSMIGESSTLFNAGDTTNLIYSVQGSLLSEDEINRINAISQSPKIQKRIQALQLLGRNLDFHDFSSNHFKQNLVLIDGDLPKILSHLVLYRYMLNIQTIGLLVEELNRDNPLDYDMSYGHLFYEAKIRNFLTDAALGMTPSALWNGIYDATGGIIYVKDDGELVCYHIYNRNEFQQYLFNNTRLEQASTTRYDFGKIYTDNEEQFMKLNLQIRYL